jgi:hypothetical protein
MHSYSGMAGVHSSTKNLSLTATESIQKSCRSWEILHSQENTHCGYYSILSVRNDGLMQVCAYWIPKGR